MAPSYNYQLHAAELNGGPDRADQLLTDLAFTETRAASADRLGHAIAQLPLSDSGNAEMFQAMYGDLVRYDHARNRWLVWAGHRWQPDDDESVRLMALNSVRERLKLVHDDHVGADDRIKIARWAIRSEDRSRLDALLSIARAMKPIADSGKGWDVTPGLLGVANGVIELRTGELREGRPGDRITMSTGIEYDPVANCPRWDRFLAEVLDDDEVAKLMQVITGYSLTAEAVLHLLIFLMGTGRNGKGTFFRTMSSALGDYARVISAHAFADARRNAHTTEVADLELARFAICEELPDNDKINAERLKDLSGGGVKTARRMREDPRQFRQTWLNWFSTNGMPQTSDNSWGFWQRVVAIDFPHTFIGPKADTELDAALAEELPGILAWAVRGAVEWYESGQRYPNLPDAVIEKTAEYREDQDRLAPLFTDGYLERCDDDVWTPAATLYEAHKAYANARGILYDKRWSEAFFGKQLAAQHTRKRRQVLTTEGPRQYIGYHGVRVGPATKAVSTASTASWRMLEDKKTMEPVL